MNRRPILNGEHALTPARSAKQPGPGGAPGTRRFLPRYGVEVRVPACAVGASWGGYALAERGQKVGAP